MTRWIVGLGLQFRFLVIVVAAILVTAGLVQLSAMPVDVLPEFSPPYVEIQTEALGLSAEEVEQMITVPMEQDLLAGVAWADVIRSKSVPGLSSVVVFFEPGTDLFRARQMVSERLAQAAVGLPHVSKPPTMIQPLSSSSRFMIIGLSSQNLSLIEMSVLARWVIAPRLLGVPGVANVATWGNRERQIQVLVDPERLRAQGVLLEQVVETTGNALWVSSLSFLEASSPGTGGFIDTPNQRLGVWHALPISSPEDLAQVPLVKLEGAPNDGRDLVLSDVAELVEDHQPLIGDAIVNDTSNLLLVIEKLPGTNTLEVTRGVEDALEALRPGMAGINFDATLFRPASFIEAAMANLFQSLIVGAVLVVVVFSAFLFGWRTALISLVTIPLALLAALLVLYYQGATLNTVILAGLVIALGVVIDDASADVEHIVQRLQQAHTEGSASPATLILEAVVEMRGTVFFATLIALLAVLPIFVLEGVMGALFQPLAVTYILATVTSMGMALLVTPALSLILLASAPKHTASPLTTWLQRIYTQTVSPLISKPLTAYALITILLVAAVVATPFLRPQQLLPTFKEPYVLIQLNGAPGSSHTAMNRIVIRASEELRVIPGVQNVSAHIGRAVLGDQVVGINSAQLWVKVDPQNYAVTMAAIEDTVNGYAGLEREVTTYLEQAVGQPLVNTEGSVTVRLFGEDHNVLRTEAVKLQQLVAGISGVANAQVVWPPEEPTLEIEVNLAAAQTHGIKPGDVRRAAAILLSGLQVGALFEEQKVFDVVVWGIPDVRQNLSTIRDLLIDAPSGGHVRLGDVAEVRIAPAPTIIHREAISPYLDVTFTIQDRDPQTVLGNVQAALKGFTFPLEYHASVLAETETQQALQQRLLLATLVAIIGIFLLLQAVSGSWQLAGVALLALVVSLTGGIVAALLNGPLSLSTLFGLLAVLGLAARHNVLFFSHCRRLEQAGQDFGLELVLRGARERVGPVLTTTLASALGVLPFVILGDRAGYEMVRPIAIIILGGLVTSTLVTLLVTPAIYLSLGASRETDIELQAAAVTA